jgi:hypothetical protein
LKASSRWQEPEPLLVHASEARSILLLRIRKTYSIKFSIGLPPFRRCDFEIFADFSTDLVFSSKVSVDFSFLVQNR